MEDVGILVEVVGVQIRASDRFAKCNMPWHICNYCYLMVICVLSAGSRRGLTAACCKSAAPSVTAPAHLLEGTS